MSTPSEQALWLMGIDADEWLKKHDEEIRADERAKVREEVIDEDLQKFAQWLWDSHYLVDEAFTIRLVEQYKAEQLKGQKNDSSTVD